MLGALEGAQQVTKGVLTLFESRLEGFEVHAATVSGCFICFGVAILQ